MKEQELADKNLILKVTTGSRLYGTDTPQSDWDKQGIFIPPKEYLIGLHRCDQVITKTEEGDYTCYTLSKYIKLAIDNNPNILSLLYTPQNCILYINDYGRQLIDNRSLFLSKKSYHTFRGYAHSQRIKLLNKNPEGKRVEMTQKYGYDVKFATHLIRLLYEGLDILIGKEIIYPSTHRIQLRAIRNGEWGLDKVLAEADRIEHLIDEAYVKSDLQYSANIKEIEQLQIDMLEKFWNDKY